MFLYFASSNYLCRFSSALTDVHMDTSTKLARRGSLNRVYPQTCQTVWAHFGRFICNCLNCYFTTSRLYLHLNCFFFLIYFPVHIISRRIQFWICYTKGRILKIKNAMVTFISIDYSEPKILTRNLHHHSPSYLAVLFYLREKLARHVPILDSPVNFAEQYSSLIGW